MASCQSLGLQQRSTPSVVCAAQKSGATFTDLANVLSQQVCARRSGFKEHEVPVQHQIQRLELNGPLTLAERTLCLADDGEVVGVQWCAMAYLGLQIDGPLELCSGSLQIPVVPEEGVAKRRVGFGQRVVQLQCSHRCRFRFWPHVARPGELR